MSGVILYQAFFQLLVKMEVQIALSLCILCDFGFFLKSKLSDSESATDIVQHNNSTATTMHLNLDCVCGIDCTDDRRSTGSTGSRILFFQECSRIHLVNVRTVASL